MCHYRGETIFGGFKYDLVAPVALSPAVLAFQLPYFTLHFSRRRSSSRPVWSYRSCLVRGQDLLTERCNAYGTSAPDILQDSCGKGARGDRSLLPSKCLFYFTTASAACASEKQQQQREQTLAGAKNNSIFEDMSC